jgi:hypothetical protein
MNMLSLVGLTEYHLKSFRKFAPWGFAMNGQTSRLEATRQIIYHLAIERIVETGTYRATTTEWFSQFGIPVETVEVNSRFFSFSKARLARFSNTLVIQKSSVQFLKDRIAGQSVPYDMRHLFYVDSHWYNNLPLRDELMLIFANYPNSVVLIDDFKVADDRGYGYDDYGPDATLDLAYLENSKIPSVSVFYPATPSYQETGMRRGWVVLTANKRFDEMLETVKLLRRYSSISAKGLEPPQ